MRAVLLKMVPKKIIKLMIVDDSNIIRQRIARAVVAGKISNMTVAAMAKNGVVAIDMCQEHMPDIVTMDLTMPEMGGVICIQKLLKIKPDVMILVVSALSDKATALKALELGAYGFLCKPFTDDQLADALNELMEDT